MRLCDTVLGGQWGDEGKAKAIDFLSKNYDVISRYQGGANAGHTVWHKKKRYIFHLIPSGILHRKKQIILANGVYVHLPALTKEIRRLEKEGINFEKRFKLSEEAFLVLPYHIALDTLREKASYLQKKGALGTTKRGIGPCSMDKQARIGIKVGELFNKKGFEEKLANNLEEKCYLYEFYSRQLTAAERQTFAASFNAKEIMKESLRYFETVKPYVGATQVLLHEAIERGRKVLFEGAQGAGLDIDFGTYPYVTSTSTTIGGVSCGTGVPPNYFRETIGIFKSYLTRVGEGPLLTELSGAEEKRLRELGGEYGATTGRPRRCGWFDAVQARHSLRTNGITQIFLTKLDVLDSYKTIKVCVAYKTTGGKRIKHLPSFGLAEQLKPVYRELPGWQSSTAGLTVYQKMPAAAKGFIAFLEKAVGGQIKYLSTGPERSQVIVR